MQLPKLLELVGLGYSAWFVYRYLLFKVSSQQQASTRIQAGAFGTKSVARTPEKFDAICIWPSR